MRNDLTELVFILDKSGSMHGLEADTIGGFNSLIEKQKKEDGKALVTTVLFDDKTEVIHDRVDLEYIRNMSSEQYVTGGTTALLDAVGGAVSHIRKIHKYIRPEDVPAKTLFIITTDGMENASRRFTYDKVKKLIKHQNEKYGWEFIFLGANIDAAETAVNMGISRDRAADYISDREGTALNYSVLSEVTSAIRSGIGVTPDWSKSISDDISRRKR
ncbi:MAG: vWA domain-containing protein [Oscillospiraceae bacterium]|nr:vWA domain-containing protein [Oscillospiraceae bacterium]